MDISKPNQGNTVAGTQTENIRCGERFLREQDRAVKTGIPRSSWRDLMAKGLVPAPVRLPGGRVAWVESELDAWMASRIALRDSSKTN